MKKLLIATSIFLGMTSVTYAANTTFSTFINGLTVKAAPAAADLFYVNDQAGGSLDKSTTLQDIVSSITGLNLTSQVTGTLPVANGGTGAATLTGLLLGNGTSAITTVTAPSGTVVGTSDSQTLTNKVINASNNTVTNVSLSTGVTGSLPVGNLNSGTGASASTYWSGAGTWTTPIGSGGSSQWASTTSNTGIYPNGGTGISILVGETSTTTNSLLEVNGLTTSSSFNSSSNTASNIAYASSTSITVSGLATTSTLNANTINTGGVLNVTANGTPGTAGVSFSNNSNPNIISETNGGISIYNNSSKTVGLSVDQVLGSFVRARGSNVGFESNAAFIAGGSGGVGTAASPLFALVNNGNGVFFPTANGQLYTAFSAGSIQLLSISPTGNGIGTTTPIADFQVATSTANATTSIENGKAGQSKGTCHTEFDSAGTPVYYFWNAGATTPTYTSTKPSGCQL